MRSGKTQAKSTTVQMTIATRMADAEPETCLIRGHGRHDHVVGECPDATTGSVHREEPVPEAIRVALVPSDAEADRRDGRHSAIRLRFSEVIMSSSATGAPGEAAPSLRLPVAEVADDQSDMCPANCAHSS